MADVNVSALPISPKTGGKSEDSQGNEGIPAVELIELLFFSYRDFVGDADEHPEFHRREPEVAGNRFGRRRQAE